MTDRHGIGRKMEQEAFKHGWKWHGWHGFWQPPRSKFQSQDIFGVFDFLCIGQFGDLVAVQVCMDRKCWVEPRVKAIKDWDTEQNHPCLLEYVMAYKREKDGSVVWRTVGPF